MIEKLCSLIADTTKEFYMVDDQNRSHKVHKINSFNINNDKYYDSMNYDYKHRKNNTVYNIMITRIVEEEDKILIYL